MGMLVAREATSQAPRLSLLEDPRDRALATELFNCTLRWIGLIDRYLKPFSKRPLYSLTPKLRNALRLGAAQLLLIGVRDHAAIDSTVGCLPKVGERSYCNGVLREMARCKGHVELPSIDGCPWGYLSARYSYPEWMSRLFLKRFGMHGAVLFCRAGNAPPPLNLRVNTLKVSRNSFLEKLQKVGYDAAKGRLPETVKVIRSRGVTDIPGYEEGEFVVQDEGAVAVGHAIGLQPGQTVWDVCAAPGGKATHAGLLVGPGGKVLATDIAESRISMVNETAHRLGLTNLETRALDATQERPEVLFDVVLLDAPCSGLGVLARNPDLRWNRRPADIPAMVRRQEKLLEQAATRVKFGGILVYSTCTVTPEENEGVWTGFLEKHREFEPQDPACQVTEGLFVGEAGFVGPGYRYLLPHISKTDGFFVARAKKMSDEGRSGLWMR